LAAEEDELARPDGPVNLYYISNCKKISFCFKALMHYFVAERTTVSP
jgi:hypothetical protein